MSKTRSYQWYPGDMYNSLYGDVQIHSYYFSDKPVRPKGKEHDPYIELSRQTREKAAKQALILIRLQFDRMAQKVTYSCWDLRKNQVHGEYTTSTKGKTDQELTDRLKDKALNKVFSPMELLTLSMKSAKSNPFQLKFGYAKSVYAGFTHEAEHQRRTIAITLEPYWPAPGQRMFALQVLRVIGPPPDYIYTHGPTGGRFHSEQDAFDFVSDWYAEKFLSPMEMLATGLSDDSDTAKSNPEESERLLHWALDGGTSKIDFYRSWHNGKTIVVGVEGRRQSVPHYITSFLVIPDERRFDGRRHVSHQGPVRTQEFKNPQEALDFAEQWFIDNCLSPMELMSLAMKANPMRAKQNPDFRLPFKQGAFSFYYEAKHKNHLVSAWVETRSDCLNLHRSEVMTFSSEGQLSSRTEVPAGLDFHTLQDALDHVSHWYADTYLSPMDLLGLGLTANENPRYLARRNPQLSWTKTDEVHLHGSDDISRLIVYETRYDRIRWLRLDLSEHTELETPYYSVDAAYVETPEGTTWLHRELKADFDTEEEALEHFENYFFTHFTTPMEMLSTSLKANPRRKYTDVKGRSIPARYLKGLPKELQEKRIQELGKSRDAYKRGDYSELPTDKAARKLGLVKQSAYSIVAERRGIEWRGDAEDMVRRVLKHYKVKASEDVMDHMVEAIQRVYNKGLAAWKSGGHRPGATAKNWAVARVASLVVGGKAAFTADKKEFSWFPAALRKKIVARQKEVISELRRQNREDDIKFLENV
jgi:hypothetical protein